MTHEEFVDALPGLVEDYQPSPDVLKKIGNVELLMTVGPSGVGKTTLMQRMGLLHVLVDTTRQMRKDETEGFDYHFREDYDQIAEDIKSGRFVQINVFNNGELYATKESSYPQSGQAEMAVAVAAVPIFRRLGFKKTIAAFVTPPTYEEWMRRLQGVEKDQLDKRLEEARNSFDFALNDNQMHFILNDDLDKAVQQTKDLLAGKVDEAREQKARQAAQNILNRID